MKLSLLPIALQVEVNGMLDSRKLSFGKDLKSLSKDSVIYGISSAIGRMVHVLLAPILTRIFAPQDYGIISLIQVAISFFVIVAGANIISGMFHYYYRFDEEEKRRQTLGTGIIVISLFALVTSGGLYIFSSEIASLLENRADANTEYDLSAYLRIASIGLFFSLISSLFQSILRLAREPFKFLLVEAVRISAHFAAVILFVIIMNKGIEGVFWAGVFAPFVALGFGLFFIKKRIDWVVSLPILGLVLAYCIPQIPGVLVNWAQSQLGRVFLNFYVPLTDLGLYSIAFTVSSIFLLFITAFRMAFDPYALSIMKNEDAPRFYARFHLLYGVAFGCLFAVVNAFARPLLMLLTPPSYHDAYDLVIFFLIGHFYMGINNILGIGISISRKTIFISYAQFFSFIVFIASNFLLVPYYGSKGAAVAFMCGTITQTFAYYVFAQKLWPAPYRFWKVNALILLLAIIGSTHNTLAGSTTLWTSIKWGVATSGASIFICACVGYPDFIKPIFQPFIHNN